VENSAGIPFVKPTCNGSSNELFSRKHFGFFWEFSDLRSKQAQSSAVKSVSREKSGSPNATPVALIVRGRRAYSPRREIIRRIEDVTNSECADVAAREFNGA
jgi:hypothetical protein